MENLPISDVPIDFGHWLAGLIDGEGCFRIQRLHHATSPTYSCSFTLKLRDDDTDVLMEVAATTGIGTLHPDKARSLGSRPCIVWRVQSKADCAALAYLVRRFPLRTRKQRDAVVWCEAVDVWLAQPRGNRWHGPADHSALAALRERLSAARAYT